MQFVKVNSRYIFKHTSPVLRNLYFSNTSDDLFSHNSTTNEISLEKCRNPKKIDTY